MKKTIFLLLSILMLLMCVDASAKKKSLKISVTPSDAKISIDGNYVGDGIVEFPITSKDNFLVIKIEKEGYLTVETKFYTSDKRNAVSYTLRPDLFYEASTPNGNANKFFSVEVSKDLYSIDEETGKKDAEKAWKLIHQILLNYFDELQTTDISSGFIQTPWKYRQFGESKQVIRTRVTVKQMGVSDNLVFQIKISSEQAPLIGMNNENSYTEVTRLLKEYDSLISEFQARLSRK